MNFIRSDLFRRRVGSHEKVGAKEKFTTSIEIEWMPIGGRVREFKKERAHDGQAGARHLFCNRIEIGHEAITLFDVAAADGELLGAVDPRLVRSSSFGCMVAIDGLERGEFKPFGEQICGRRAGKTANVRARHGETAEAEVQNLRHGHAQVVPGGAVVSGPCGGISLASRIACTSEDEGMLIGMK